MAESGATAGDPRGAGDKALDEIYLGDFDGFIGRRDELAKQLRSQGDTEAASRTRALKKPSRVAWAVNQVSGREAKLRDELLDAGTALREAQERVVAGRASCAELRATSEQERAAVSRALDAVEALAEGAGTKLSPAAVERARQTLHAVALDEDARRDFERHRTTTDREAAGLAGLSLCAAPAAGKSATRTAPRNDGERQAEKRWRDELKAAQAAVSKYERRQQKAEREVEAARQSAERAQQHLERATDELETAASETAAARERVERLRTRSS